MWKRQVAQTEFMQLFWYVSFGLYMLFIQEKITVKDDKIKTTQTEDELKQSFLPGNAFGFNVEIELVNEQPDTDTDTETETPSEAET